MLQIQSKSDIGLKRTINQDAFFVGEISDGVVFAVVCDGMGGASAGNIASDTAVKTISKYVLSSFRDNMKESDIEKLLINAITSANLDIYDMSLKNPQLNGMGTTVVATIIKNQRAVIAHVGDSRAYLISDKMIQLTRDHSIVQTLLESGKITQEDAKIHPKKNVITRALGVEENIICDITNVDILKDSGLLLCTDGLTGYTDTEKIYNIITTENTNASKKLVELANSGGGGDNITVVLITNKEGI